MYKPDRQSLFVAQEIKHFPKVLIISLPKCGTYLLGAFCKSMGFIDTEVHLSDNGYTDYRQASDTAVMQQYHALQRVAPLHDSLQCIGRGQFAVGHLGYSRETDELTESFKRVFAIRELRCALVSLLRWFSQRANPHTEHKSWRGNLSQRQRMIHFLEDQGAAMFGWFNAVAGWRKADVLTVNFEKLISCDTQTRGTLASLIAAHVGVTKNPFEAASLFDRVLKMPTKTWSGALSDPMAWWSTRSEQLFTEQGWRDLNSLLGYHDDHF